MKNRKPGWWGRRAGAVSSTERKGQRKGNTGVHVCVRACVRDRQTRVVN